MILRVVLIVLFTSFSLMTTHKRSCSKYEHQHRGRPNLDTSILSPSQHFKIYYDKTGEHAATDSYANDVAEFADQVRDVIVNDLGFLSELDDQYGDPDIYDIYIQDLGAYNYGYHIPDINLDLSSSSYILIDNEFEEGEYYTTGLKAMKLTLAHEFFHAIQLAYREKSAGEDEYFYEMMGTWMEDIIVPDGNDYIHWVDIDDNINDEKEPFFINPEMSMTASNGYSIALFAHYLNNVYSNGNTAIIREIWEEIAILGYTCGIDCGLNSINNVLLDNYNVNFEEAWNDFTSRLFFNGSNDYGNNLFFHEDQMDIISLSTYLPNPENINVGEIFFTIDLNNVSSKYKLYETNSFGVLSFEYENVASSEFVDNISVISQESSLLNQHLNDLSSVYVDEDDIIVFTSSSSSNELSLNVKINYSNDLTLFELEGDCSLDGVRNIQDIILMIEFLLYNTNFNSIQFENADMNNDNSINIFDVILLIELILD